MALDQLLTHVGPPDSDNHSEELVREDLIGRHVSPNADKSEHSAHIRTHPARGRMTTDSKHKATFAEVSKKAHHGVEGMRIKSKVELTADQETKVKLAFEQYDADHSGMIDKGELMTVMRALGHMPTSRDDEERLFRYVDRDGDGLVDYNEFLLMMTERFGQRAVPGILIHLKCAKNLALSSENPPPGSSKEEARLPDPSIQFVLGKFGTYTTRVQRHTRNPVYNEDIFIPWFVSSCRTPYLFCDR